MTKKAAKKKASKKKTTNKKAKFNPAKPLDNGKYEYFCQEYISHYNATAAWRTANNKEQPGDRAYASKLLTNNNVHARIKHLEAVRNEERQLDKDKLRIMLSDMAEADVSEAYDEDGVLKPLHQIPKNIRLLIEGIETVDQKERDEDGKLVKVGELKKVKWAKRHKTIELAGKHVDIQAFKDNVDVHNKLSLADLVAGAQDDDG